MVWVSILHINTLGSYGLSPACARGINVLGGHVESLAGTPILSLQSFEKLQFLRVRLWMNFKP